MELGRSASRVVPHHNQVRTAQCTRACSMGGRPILHGAMSARAARHVRRMRYFRRSEVAAADLISGRTAEPRPTNREERVASWPAPQPSPHRVVHAHVLHGRSADSWPGDERAGRAPREPNAVSPTVRSRNRRPDAVIVRLSLSHGAGEERVASCPTPQPSPHRAVHAHVFRWRSADSSRGDERAGRAPRESNAVLPTF